MANYNVKPAHVFAHVNIPPEPVGSSNSIKTKSAPSNDSNFSQVQPSRDVSTELLPSKHIQVSATGQLSVAPDLCRFVISVSNRKESIQDVRNSVSRRIDYVLQTLRNHQVKDSDFKVSQSFQRVDNLHQLDTDVVVNLRDVNKFQPICNILNEKLDDHANFSGPALEHTPNRMEALRREAAVLAVENSKLKAMDLAKAVNAKVGRVIGIREENTSEWFGPLTETPLDGFRPTLFDQMLKESTFNVVVRVIVTFELQSKQKSKDSKG